MGSSEIEINLSKDKTKTYSVSLTPNEVEKIKGIGYSLSDVAKIGVKTVLFKNSFLIKNFPSISVEIGMGLILLSFSFILSESYVLMSYVLLFASLFFIAMSFVTVVYLIKLSNRVGRGKNGS